MVRSLQLEALHYLSDMPLICLNSDAVTIPFNDAVEYSPALLEVWSPPSTCFLISYFLDIILMRDSTADRCPPIVMSSPCTVATMSSSLDAASPHARARASPRQPETAERRCQFLFPILCGVTCAVQAVSQQSTHMFVTRLVVLGRQFDKHFSSCWSVKVRPPHVDQCQYLSLTFARCDLRQYDFQRLPMAVSTHTALVWRVSCTPSQPISRAH